MPSIPSRRPEALSYGHRVLSSYPHDFRKNHITVLSFEVASPLTGEQLLTLHTIKQAADVVRPCYLRSQDRWRTPPTYLVSRISDTFVVGVSAGYVGQIGSGDDESFSIEGSLHAGYAWKP